MAKLSKRMAEIKKSLDKTKVYSVVEGFDVVKKFAT